MARRIVATLALGFALLAGLAIGGLGWNRDTGSAAPAKPAVTAQAPLSSGDVRNAERNLFPSPETALQMADHLALDQSQRQRLRNLQQAADGEVLALARRIAAEEQRLDRAFAEDNIDLNRIDTITGNIGVMQAELRAARLRSHLATRRLLTADQVLRFAEINGFQPAALAPYDDLAGDDLSR